MISEAIKDKLKSNWGEKANALACYVEVKFIDPLSSWACYIFAMDRAELFIHCVLYSNALGPEIYTLSLDELSSVYNSAGENPVIDPEFRRIRVIELLTRLKHDT